MPGFVLQGHTYAITKGILVVVLSRSSLGVSVQLRRESVRSECVPPIPSSEVLMITAWTDLRWVLLSFMTNSSSRPSGSRRSTLTVTWATPKTRGWRGALSPSECVTSQYNNPEEYPRRILESRSVYCTSQISSDMSETFWIHIIFLTPLADISACLKTFWFYLTNNIFTIFYILNNFTCTV